MRLHIAPVVMFAAIAGLAGCKEAAVIPTAPAVSAQTPEARFEAAMTRLQSMLAEAQAAASSGVVSERTSEHRLIPPKSEGESYRAEVTIKTKVALAAAPAASTLPQPTGEVELADDETATDDERANEELISAIEGEVETTPATIRPDNGVTRQAIAQSVQEEAHLYELVYENDRWKLVTEPKTETDKLVFEYALGK